MLGVKILYSATNQTHPLYYRSLTNDLVHQAENNNTHCLMTYQQVVSPTAQYYFTLDVADTSTLQIRED